MNLMGVVAREQGCSRWPAAACIVKLGIAEAVGCERVEVWSFDFAAIAAEVGVAEIVC